MSRIISNRSVFSSIFKCSKLIKRKASYFQTRKMEILESWEKVLKNYQKFQKKREEKRKSQKSYAFKKVKKVMR